MALENGEHCGGFCKAPSWPGTSRLCVILSLPRLLPVICHHETILLSGELGVCFTDFFVFCLYFVFFFFFKASFEFEGTSLLIICRSCCHEEREGVPSSVHFHVLNLISGSCSYLPCQAQFTISPEAWGRDPSRRRLILLALSLLGEMNALCNI